MKNFRILHDQVMARPGAAERIAALSQETLAEIGLYALGQARELSHTELAGRLQITRSASAFDDSDDVQLSTLRQYIEALGGHLEISARFDDRVVALEIGAR